MLQVVLEQQAKMLLKSRCILDSKGDEAYHLKENDMLRINVVDSDQRGVFNQDQNVMDI